MDLPPVPTVLVVDDDPSVREVVCAMFGIIGFQVCEARGGREALQILSWNTEVSLLVTDIRMPDMSGVALAAEAHRLRPGLAILLTSGYPGDAPASRQRWPYLPKPFDLRMLTRAITLATARAERQR